MNRSHYGRHRSIKKGKKNQLAAVLAELKRKADSYEEFTTKRDRYGAQTASVMKQMEEAWGASSYKVKLKQGIGWLPEPEADCGRLKIEKVPEPLRSAVQRIWFDMVIILADAFDIPHAPGLVAIAYSNDFFDIIVSKHGLGEGLKHNHHFYHWHVKAKDAKLNGHPAVYVDDVNADSRDVTPTGRGKMGRMEALETTGLFG